MDIQFNKKTSIGAITTLTLVIILSQSRFFDFLIDSHLGRIILVALIICISYTHKILGVLAVLFIIIMFNFNRDGFSEGFDSKVPTSPTAPTPSEDTKKNQVVVTNTNASIPAKKPKASSTEGREGSNMVEREGAMLRGKSSNEVPVSKSSRGQGDNVEPADAQALKEGFFSSV
jgi:hypothetical protein